MCKVSRGSIIYCEVPFTDFNPHATAGGHYYIILSNRMACEHSPVVQALPCSTNTTRGLPSQCEVRNPAFSKRTIALAEQLTLLPKDVLERGQLKGVLASEAMCAVEKAVKIQLGLP